MTNPTERPEERQDKAARYEQALDRIIAGSKPRGLHGKTRLTRDMMQMVAYEARYPRKP